MHLEDQIPVRPSAEGYPPEGDLLIGSRSREVRLGRKASMKKGGVAREGQK